MKVFLILLIADIAGLQAKCESETQCPELHKFAQMHACSKDIGSFAGYPKKEISRILNAIRMKKCIEVHNLYLLGVAKKCVFKSSGWGVVANPVKGYWGDIKISLQLLEQLMKLAEETGFRDWGPPGNRGNNWIWNRETQKLICIDTEDDSFSSNRHCQTVYGAPINCKLNYVNSLLRWLSLMEPEAQNRLFQRIAELKAFAEGTEKQLPLPLNPKYDSTIDFQKVRREYGIVYVSKLRREVVDDLW